MEFCEAAVTFESMNKILWSEHSNETSLPVLSLGATCFSKLYNPVAAHKNTLQYPQAYGTSALT